MNAEKRARAQSALTPEAVTRVIHLTAIHSAATVGLPVETLHAVVTALKSRRVGRVVLKRARRQLLKRKP